jgi:hypothetical protein
MWGPGRRRLVTASSPGAAVGSQERRHLAVSVRHTVNCRRYGQSNERVIVRADEAGSWGNLRALVMSHRVVGSLLAILIVLYGGLQTVETYFKPSRGVHLGISIAEPILAALASSLLASWIVLRVQTSWQRRAAYGRLRVLGIARELEHQQVAFVLPEFPHSTGGFEAGAITLPNLATAMRARLGFSPTDAQVAGKTGAGSVVYNRRDVLLMTDLVTLIGQAGLPQPLVTSDHAVIRALTGNASGKGALSVSTGDNESDSRIVSTLVVIGLWSNVLTHVLSQSESVPLTIGPFAPRTREVRLTSALRQDPFIKIEDLGHNDSPNGDEAMPTVGVICRFRFKDLKVIVVGGIRALGSARMGDLICGPESRLPALWQLHEDDDFWALISCPGMGDRWGVYEEIKVYTENSGVGNSQRRSIRLADLVSEQATAGENV